MHKKYKTKKRRNINIYAIFAILIISLIFMSCGYALWSEKLKITGKANIKVEETTENEAATMQVEFPSSLITVALMSGFKSISDEVIDGNLISTIETVDSSTSEMFNNFTFYVNNKTGYTATDGKSEITITGNSDAIGDITQYVPTTLAHESPTMFHFSAGIVPAKILQETKIDIDITYTVNGELLGFHYYIVIKPGT